MRIDTFHPEERFDHSALAAGIESVHPLVTSQNFPSVDPLENLRVIPIPSSNGSVHIAKVSELLRAQSLQPATMYGLVQLVADNKWDSENTPVIIQLGSIFVAQQSPPRIYAGALQCLDGRTILKPVGIINPAFGATGALVNGCISTPRPVHLLVAPRSH